MGPDLSLDTRAFNLDPTNPNHHCPVTDQPSDVAMFVSSIWNADTAMTVLYRHNRFPSLFQLCAN